MIFNISLKHERRKTTVDNTHTPSESDNRSSIYLKVQCFSAIFPMQELFARL